MFQAEEHSQINSNNAGRDISSVHVCKKCTVDYFVKRVEHYEKVVMMYEKLFFNTIKHLPLEARDKLVKSWMSALKKLKL